MFATLKIGNCKLDLCSSSPNRIGGISYTYIF